MRTSTVQDSAAMIGTLAAVLLTGCSTAHGGSPTAPAADRTAGSVPVTTAGPAPSTAATKLPPQRYPSPARTSQPPPAQTTTLRGDIQVKQSLSSYECVGYGTVAMQLTTAGHRISGSFFSGALQNDAGCTTTTISGFWSGTIDEDAMATVDECTANGSTYDSANAYLDNGELNLNCSRIGAGDVLYEVDLQVHYSR